MERKQVDSAAIEAFLGLGALVPGWLLLREPSGAALGLRLEWIAGSPLRDYFIPGLFLFGVIGLGNLGLVALTLRAARPRLAAQGGAAMGCFLLAWIGVQAAWLEPRSWLQPFIFSLGLALLVLNLNAARSGRP